VFYRQKQEISAVEEPLIEPTNHGLNGTCQSQARINTRPGPFLSPTAVSALWRVALPFIGFGIAHLM
jgi:hypothetical protein